MLIKSLPYQLESSVKSKKRTSLITKTMVGVRKVQETADHYKVTDDTTLIFSYQKGSNERGGSGGRSETLKEGIANEAYPLTSRRDNLVCAR